MNLLSRIAGAARLLATGKLAQSAGFDGAQMQRRLMTWRAGGETINCLILQGGELQRARARQLVRTNPYAANASASFTAHAVGCGIKPSSLVDDGVLKDQIQRLWLAWTDEADADGLTDFYGLQAMAARVMFEAGECFLRFRPRRPDDGLTVPLQLQMLSAEHLPLGKCETLPNGNEVIFGIELDRIGRRVAYHFHRTHPGDVRQRGAGELVRVPENAMLVLHDPSGLVAGTAADMRATADALDKMAAAMVAAYRDKSGAGDAEIAAPMAAETWLSAEEALELGLADHVEQPVRMAAHFDLSHFRNAPSQLAALASVTAQEDEMSDKTRPRKPGSVQAAAAEDTAPVPGSEQIAGAEDDRPAEGDQPVAANAELPPAPDGEPAAAAVAHRAMPTAPATAAQPTAQVIDLDAVRADERRATLAYVGEVHELCALAGRGDLVAGFLAKATPVVHVRRALLEARAAEDETTAIRSQVRPALVEPAQPAIDTAAIYATRNQNVR